MPRPPFPLGRPDLTGASYDDNYLFQGSPNALYRSNFPLWTLTTAVLGNIALSATGVGLAAPIALQQGDIISKITFITATTAASTPTHQYVALYDNAATPNLLATSGDLTTTARAANTVYTISFANSQQITIPAAGVYFVSISFTATAVPTVLGATAFNVADVPLAGILSDTSFGQSHGTALAGVAPATIASPTAVTTCPLFILT